MKTNALQRWIVTVLLATACMPGIACGAAQTGTQPNFVIIFCDDLGYGDIGWLGPVKNHTPNIDTMAAEGACFTDFYSTSGVCSPSRASLMTGCYPLRVGMHKSSKGMFVLVPKDRKGLHPDEITIAEVLKENSPRYLPLIQRAFVEPPGAGRPSSLPFSILQTPPSIRKSPMSSRASKS